MSDMIICPECGEFANFDSVDEQGKYNIYYCANCQDYHYKLKEVKEVK